MPAPRLSDEVLKQAAEAYKRHGTNGNRELGIPRSTFEARVTAAINRGFCTRDDRRILADVEVATATPLADETMLRDQIRTLRAQLASATRSSITDEIVRREIIKLAEAPVDVPTWAVEPPRRGDITGVPTLFASDWHWGERVFPEQINGVNEYSIEIAQRRAHRMISAAVDLLKHHVVDPKYPGIVFALGGDMLSGDLHEELSESNELSTMPALLDLFGVLTWCITTLADEFGAVFVPCVTGNHGRNTKKPRAKSRNYSNFDWLLYSFLAKRFELDKRVRFLIPDGPDAHWQVFGVRYCMTHGDQFRGGDGMIGALGPIIRGDHKKRSRNGQIDMGYDVLMLGHWHQLIQLQRLIVNGSLKGYDEYAAQGNFGFEPPQQACWITHPKQGITFSMPIHVEPRRPPEKREWVSWPS